MESRIGETANRRSQQLLDWANQNITHVEQDWLRDSEEWVRNAERRNYGCPDCSIWFFTSAAVHIHMDNAYSSHAESANRNDTNEGDHEDICENAQGLWYGCTHCTQYFYSECLAVNHMRSHTKERNGEESEGESRSENNEDNSTQNNGAETEENRVTGGVKNNGEEVTRVESAENNSAETEENRVTGGAKNNGAEVRREKSAENNGAENQENRVTGGTENNGAEVRSEETEGSEAEREESEEVQGEKGESELENENNSDDSDTIPVLDDNDLSESTFTK